MPLPNVFELVEDIQEFCFVLSHAFQLHELLHYSLEQVDLLRARVAEKLTCLQGPTLTIDKKLLDSIIPTYFGTNTSSMLKTEEMQRRLSSLEKEVAELKKHLSTFSNEPLLPNQLSTIAEDSTLANCPPPPPPPPPPADIPVKVIHRKSQRKTLSECNVSDEGSKLDMVSVLKGLKDVKLRRTERSPGGTPLRRLGIRNSSDPNDLMRLALQKRFERIQVNDSNLTSNKENLDDSWERSPSSSNRSFDS